jgi:hypothetical protein
MTAGAAAFISSDGATLCPAADPFALAEANINPVTGLSTDYLNHFNEAVMLLELIPSMPECRDDLMAWRPTTYQQHFAASHLRHRALAIAAYDLADAFTRRQFDDLCAAMTTTVVAVREALAGDLSSTAAAAIAEQAVAWLKPLIARTSAVIHGLDINRGETVSLQESQAAVDALLEP